MGAAAANPTAPVDRDQSQDGLGVSMCLSQDLAMSLQPRLLKARMAVSYYGVGGQHDMDLPMQSAVPYALGCGAA